MKTEKKVNHLNVFLVKETFNQSNQIINQEGCEEPVEIQIPGCGKGHLYIKPKMGHPPKWSSLFAAYLDIRKIGNVSNVSAALLIKVEDRYFVLSFGPGGRFLIRDGICEERFGLLVALNSVDKESFRCIDKQSLDTIQSHTRIQSGYETTSDQFGLDVEQDMLKAIVGTPSDSRIGNRMTGTDSLSVSVRMDLSDLDFLLRSYKEKFDCDLSATDYQWVNNISIVKNSAPIVATLESKLLEKFAQKDYTNLWLSIPEIIQWDLVKGFLFTDGGKTIHPDINLLGFLSTLKDDQPITLDLLKQHQVSCADEDHNKVFKTWPIYKCLYSEIDCEGNKYVLNDGKWFSVNTDFVQKTNADFAKINLSSLVLPEYCGGGEGSYNTAIAEAYPNRFALLDDKNKIFHGGGHGQVEVCDLLSLDKQLIHIKIYGKSTVFSHLFSQGFVSAQLLQLDSEFRKKVKERLNPPFIDLLKIESRPAENEFTVIFAVISDSKGDELYLPFFSRVNLNNTAKMLKGFGYNVELLKIHVNGRYAKTTILIPKKQRKS
ncbi:MAG: TIGR04141 family sporadically distributed protein [Syntrophales bacterium]|jgi:uncharacterized protein (TIGR04141 family)